MRIRIALAAVACTLLVLTGVGPTFGAGSISHSRHQRVVEYWTPARIADAKPRDFAATSTGFEPVAKHAAGGGTSTGSSWNGGGLVLRASGRVLFSMGEQDWLCSGAVAREGRSDISLVLTAAHCAYDQQTQQFAANWMFIPEFDTAPASDCAQTQHGCWAATALVVHDGYASAGGFTPDATTRDYAFAVVGPGGKSGNEQLDDRVGSFPIGFSTLKSNTAMDAFGYPLGEPHNGGDLAYCAGKAFGDPINSGRTWALACTMSGGSSGGPWLSRFSPGSGSGTLSSVNSYVYAGFDRMHGPKFDATTRSVYSAANTATANAVVSE